MLYGLSTICLLVSLMSSRQADGVRGNPAVDEAAKRTGQEPEYAAGRDRCNCEPADQLIRNTAVTGGHRCANQVWQQKAHYSTDSEKPASSFAGDEPQTEGSCNHRRRPPNLALMQICNRDARRLRR